VSMASVAGKEGNANMAPYAASKAAIIGLTKTLGKEMAPFNVQVNCVSPALIETDMAREMTPEQRALLISKIPMGRLGKPEEVAAVVKFLVSDESSFVTGQCYDISGGRSVY
jgi:2-dehydro-3-deoxy-L-rhamnonate dehydrogenase (NAD+)